jgi:putative transposase
LSERSVRRLVQQWRAEGLAGLERLERADRGVSRLSEEWQAFIMQTWRWGNREGRRMSRAQVVVRVQARAIEIGEACPSHTAVYRLLRSEFEKRQRQAPRIGWRGTRLELACKSGERLSVEQSNQVWQVDHTLVDVLLVDEAGGVVGRPWLTTVIDSYSRCIMGYHLSMDSPSAQIVCLALRQAVLPKQLPAEWEVSEEWKTCGLPQCLYTDGGQEFRSRRLVEAAAHLGIALEQRRWPSAGGIVERPFGTFNSELFSTLPGYTGSGTHERPDQAEKSARLCLWELERLLVRYVVERYNRSLDARVREQTRVGRWEVGLVDEPRVPPERELDICLMGRERRRVYRGGHLRFAGLVYRGECLGVGAGEEVIVRWDPRDIRSILVYSSRKGREEFLGVAQAVELPTMGGVSLSQAQSMGRRIATVGRRIVTPTVYSEVRRRDREIAGSKKDRDKKQGMSLGIGLPPVQPVDIPVSEQGLAAGPPEELAELVPGTPLSGLGLAAEIARLQKPCLLELPQVQAVHEWLRERHLGRQACRVVGESLTGKTMAMAAYCLLHPAVGRPGAVPLLRVVRVHLPVACDAAGLFASILQRVGYPLSAVNIVQARQRTQAQLAEHGVEMLILDTAEHLQLEAFAEVCDLHERLGMAVVLVGTEVLDRVLYRLEGVSRHFACQHTLKRLNAEELVTVSVIWERQVLKLPGASGLHRPAMQQVLGAASGGYIGLLDPLLRESAVRALRRGLDHVDLSVLQEVGQEFRA